MDNYSHPIFKELMKDSHNKKCFDCSIVNPRWASVNNGIYLCISCAGEHRKLGVTTSFVRSTNLDDWNDKYLKVLKIAGNDRLRRFLLDYSIPQEMDADTKYNLLCMDYYRRLLKAEVKINTNENNSSLNKENNEYKELIENKPNRVDGMKYIGQNGVNSGNNYSNNSNTSSVGSSSYYYDSSDSNKIYEDSNNQSSSFSSFFGKISGIASTTYNGVKTKVKDMNIPDKVKNIVNKTGELAKKTGEFAKKTTEVVADKSKDIYVSILLVFLYFYIFSFRNLSLYRI